MTEINYRGDAIKSARSTVTGKTELSIEGVEGSTLSEVLTSLVERVAELEKTAATKRELGSLKGRVKTVEGEIDDLEEELTNGEEESDEDSEDEPTGAVADAGATTFKADEETGAVSPTQELADDLVAHVEDPKNNDAA